MFTKTKQAVTKHAKELSFKSLFWVSFITRNIHSNLKKKLHHYHDNKKKKKANKYLIL